MLEWGGPLMAKHDPPKVKPSKGLNYNLCQGLTERGIPQHLALILKLSGKSTPIAHWHACAGPRTHWCTETLHVRWCMKWPANLTTALPKSNWNCIGSVRYRHQLTWQNRWWCFLLLLAKPIFRCWFIVDNLTTSPSISGPFDLHHTHAVLDFLVKTRRSCHWRTRLPSAGWVAWHLS